MRITQGYISKSVMDFPFHQIYSLDDYNNNKHAAVFFGCYRYEDVKLINSHFGLRAVFWTGQDILTVIENNYNVSAEYHFTAHPKVFELLKKRFADGLDPEITIVKPSTFLNEVNPQVLGPSIYAYCPSSAPNYHGKQILDGLQSAGYRITIGDGSIPQNLWPHCRDGFYHHVCIGLCLSEFAGGGTSIIELGLRGVKVVTNVFDLPNCIKWNTLEDVMIAIENEKKKIGQVDSVLARKVWESLDHKYEWLNV